MKVKDWLNFAIGSFGICFMETTGDVLCETKSDSKGVDPYLERELDSFQILDRRNSREINVNADALLIIKEEGEDFGALDTMYSEDELSHIR